MFKIGDDRKTLYCNRGDDSTTYFKVAFCFPIYNMDTEEIEYYEFQLDDKISFIVKEKKGYTKSEIFRIETTLSGMGYVEPSKYPEIPITSDYTKLFPIKNKRKTYWYDIVLNDNVTVLGYDDDGAKKIIVFPEGSELEDYE